MKAAKLLGIVCCVAGFAASGCNDDAYCYSCDGASPLPEAGADVEQPDDTGVDTNADTEPDTGDLVCPAGRADCNGAVYDGCEVNIDTDKTNCGACGHACSLVNAVSECVAGDCVVSECAAGFEDCDGEAATGCETETATDPENCGVCGQACDAVPQADPVCVLGACSNFECHDGFDDCNDDPSDGCETELLTDIENCGVCGRVCDALPHAAPGCFDGSCGVGECDTGVADCDNSVWSGCETILASDVNHCGACGNACPSVANGAGACVQSNCVVGSCNPGYADCDTATSDCEVYLATNVDHCGACNNACPAVPNGTPGCSHFQCGIADCDSGWGDCSGGAADGCESDLLNDINHCGTCSTVCGDVANGTRGCDQGTCGIESCEPNFDDCNQSPGDGCEVDLRTDLGHCGSCSNACPSYDHATTGCDNGNCGIAQCDPGYSDCDSQLATGCERDTSSDPDNCGGCGVRCGSGQCANSQCVCNNTALLIRDDSPTGADVLAAALTAAGLTVTTTTVPSYQYDGTNPAPTGFGAIVLLAGGPGSESSTTDMPAGGQTAIASFVGDANGLVLTEWAALHVLSGRWQTLAPLVLLKRTVAFSGQVEYTIDPAYAGHPIWDGLASTFTVASTSNVGLTHVGTGIRRLASSPQALDAVAIRDLPSEGRVVHVAHAGNYSPNGWTNPNMQKLVANAVRWSARCQ